jgi:4-hydroxy-3-polyprenylbenzoate decarboxylase
MNETKTVPHRLVVGISGASGTIYGIRLLQVLQAMPDVQTHLLLSEPARVIMQQETDWEPAAVEALADVVYAPDEMGAAIASGSFRTLGMVIIPCSIKTLSAVAHSYAANLMARAADVTLKEGRPLLLVVRETPLHLGHLRLMQQVAEIGAVVFPPVPALYGRPQTVDDIVDGTVGRVLARLGIENELYFRWAGLSDGRLYEGDH